MKIRNITSFFLVLILGVAVSSCDSGGSKSEFEILRAYTANWLATASGTISAADVNTNIDTLNVIDVRSDTSWTDTGRVDGIDGHADYKVVMDNLDLFNTNTISDSYTYNVVHCVTGNTGSIAMVGLNLMGYPTKNMKYGMMGWNSTVTGRSADLAGIEASDIGGSETYFTATETTATADNAVPVLATGASSAQAIAEARYRVYAAEQASAFDFVISPSDVLSIVDGTHATIDLADVQIVSVRSTTVYANGHVKGAINIPAAEIANPDQIKKLDPTKTIIVYCYTGHSGGQATAALNLLGYNARNVKFGMGGLTSDNALMVAGRFTADVSYAITTSHIAP